MANPLVLEDLFPLGLGFDIAGAYLLAKGLLLSPQQIRGLSGTFFGWNPREIVGRVDDKIAGTFGLLSLALGFLAQGVGYVAVLARGGTSRHGLVLGATAVAAIALGCALGWGLHAVLGARWRQKLLIEVSRIDREGQREPKPYSGVLTSLGQVRSPFRPDESAAAYLQRVFGVDEYTEGDPR